ncbi:MAG: hypothetical protein QM793_01305 [Muricomes sp.]
MQCFEIPVPPENKSKIYQKLWRFAATASWWLKLGRIVKKGDVVLYQHPLYGNRISEKMLPRIQKKSSCKFIAVIHDLESLRRGIEGVLSDNYETNKLADNVLLKKFDKVICHNESMKKYLVNQGFDEAQLVCLEIFDYLSDCDRTQPDKGMIPSIAIAGNLAKGKSRYIYEIVSDSRSTVNTSLRLHLYGNNFDNSDENENIIYHGSFKPDELAAHLEGDFGLVWDGSSPETCAGNTGEYLRYNNPHKTSMYLSAGMPVIVWSKAAIADFVLKEGVGICVDSLYEVEEKIQSISADQYKELCENAKVLSRKLKSGYYFEKALKSAKL